MSSPVLSKSPTKRPAQPKVALAIQVSPELRDRLASRALEEGRPLSALAREAIAIYVERLGGER